MYFNGTLDEFMVWNRSLNQQEVTDLYNLKEYVVNISLIGEGTHTYNLTQIDAAGNKNTTETRIYTVDSIIPLLEFINPTPLNNSNQSSDNFVVNVSTTEINLDAAVVSIDTTNFTMTCLNNICNYTATSLSEGTHEFRVTVNDSAGNHNNTNVRFVTIDTISPFVDYIETTPANNTELNITSIFINITASDVTTGVSNLTFTLVNISSGSMTELNRTFVYDNLPNTSINFTNLLNGTYLFNVTATDYAGNKNTTERRTIIIDTSISEPSSSSSSASTSSSNVGTSSAKACGDGICQPLMGETPLTCEADCGSADNLISLSFSQIKSFILSVGKLISPNYPLLGTFVFFLILISMYVLYYRNNLDKKIKKHKDKILRKNIKKNIRKKNLNIEEEYFS